MKRFTLLVVALVIVFFIVSVGRAQSLGQSNKEKGIKVTVVLHAGTGTRGPYKILNRGFVHYRGDYIVITCMDGTDKPFFWSIRC